jgi:hypothetical protein
MEVEVGIAAPSVAVQKIFPLPVLNLENVNNNLDPSVKVHHVR